MHNVTIALALTALSLTVAACGADVVVDDAARPQDAAVVANNEDAGKEEQEEQVALPLSVPVIASVDVLVADCPCRCATPTITTLTVHGTGFVAGSSAVVDGVDNFGWVGADGTLSVNLWTSPATGAHELIVRVVDEGGATVESEPATFVMPAEAAAP